MTARPLVLTLVLACGCVNPLLAVTNARTLRVDDVAVTVKWSNDDAGLERRLSDAVDKATPALKRWGTLVAPVTLAALPSHEGLEVVTGRRGYGWLRAWSTYDTVYLQSPRTWPRPPNDNDLVEWLTHELTHCVLFQQSATPATWERLHVPLWFREGLATVTARQGYRFSSLEDLAAWQSEHPALDVFEDGEALSKEHFTQVYGLSHHAVVFLLRRYGDGAVTRTVAAMREGRDFDEAFTRAVGLTPRAFARDFANYLRLRGFRGWGLPVRAQ